MIFVTGIFCLVLLKSFSVETESEIMVTAFVAPTTRNSNIVSTINRNIDERNRIGNIIMNRNYNSIHNGLRVLETPMGDEVIDVSSSSSSATPSSLETITTTSQTTAGLTNNNNNSNKNIFVDGIIKKIGRVEDERIIFPEYDTGEVPRIFSSLTYERTDNNDDINTKGTTTTKVIAKHNSGSVFGGASLVAGTMVGAGILALPSATAPVGFIPSTGAMGIGWLYMTMSGLLIAELSINRLGQSGKPGQGMLDLYEDSLGPKWSKVGSAAYFGLHYCLLVAYIAQGGSNLNVLLGLDTLGVPNGVPQAVFATAIAAGLYSAKPNIIEKANNVFVSILAVVFTGIIALGVGTADFHSLIEPSNQHPENVVNALPIIFLSLVYHNVVPTVVNQLEGDRSKITKAILFGTSVPTLMFVAWNAVVLGNVGAEAAASGVVDPVALLQSSGGNPILGNLVTIFSSLALVTSLIGFVYGLIDGWTDVFNLPTEGPSYEKWKAPLFGLVFLPPLALSLTDPDIFFTALDYGGAFGVSTLFLILPPIMVWQQRYGDEQQPLLTKPMGKF
jgi:tyrosine-specific transport protein